MFHQKSFSVWISGSPKGFECLGQCFTKDIQYLGQCFTKGFSVVHQKAFSVWVSVSPKARKLAAEGYMPDNSDPSRNMAANPVIPNFKE